MNTRFLLVAMVLLVMPGLVDGQEPGFRLQNLDHRWTTYRDIEGEQLTMLDFWATWCQPCLRSIPELNEIYNAYAERGVSLVGISVDGPRNQSKIKPFVSSMGVDYPILRDVNSELMSELNVTKVPTLLVFNAEGELVFLHEGFRPGDGELLRGELDKLLN